MKRVVKKYKLKENQQELDSITYWKHQTIEHKLEVLESLRADAIKMGLYPKDNETESGFRRVYKVTKQV